MIWASCAGRLRILPWAGGLSSSESIAISLTALMLPSRRILSGKTILSFLSGIRLRIALTARGATILFTAMRGMISFTGATGMISFSARRAMMFLWAIWAMTGFTGARATIRWTAGTAMMFCAGKPAMICLSAGTAMMCMCSSSAAGRIRLPIFPETMRSCSRRAWILRGSLWRGLAVIC